MPVMPALFIELLTPLPTLGLLDAAKVLGVPVALYLLTRFVNRRDKVRDETASEEKHALRTHNETADSERRALQAEVKELLAKLANLEARFTGLVQWTEKIGSEMAAIQAELSSVARQAGHSETNINHLKEALPRIESRISQVLDTLLRRA